MDKITEFMFENLASVRVVMVDETPWFVASDVAKALGYSQPAKAVRDHVPAGQTQTFQNGTFGRDPLIISEAGMYRLIMRSKATQAERFQDWVTSEVLPDIRRNGGYLAPQVDFSDPENMRKVFDNWAADRAKLEAAETELADKTPRADAFDSYLESAGELNLRRVMQIVRQMNGDIKEHTVTRMLRDSGHVEKWSFTATAKAVHAGYMRNRGIALRNGGSAVQGLFTPSGVRWLLKLVIGDGDARRVPDSLLDEMAGDLV